MQKYILMRLSLFLPGLVIISMLVFYLSAKSPLSALSGVCSTGNTASWSSYRACLETEWERHGLNKPLLYFSFQSLSEPNTLHLVYDVERKKAISRLLDEYGNWPEINAYFQSLAQLEDELSSLRTEKQNFSQIEQRTSFKAELIALRHLGESSEIEEKFERLTPILDTVDILRSLKPAFNSTQNRFQEIKQQPSIWKKYIPVIRWNGFDNRYHHWIKDALRLDWGKPYGNARSVNQEIKDRFGVTFTFALLNALLVYLLSIPFGIWAARYKKFDKISGSFFFALSSVPNYWLGILLLLTFANPHLELLEILPQEYKDGSYPLSERIASMILPLIVYVYSSLAALSRITRNSLMEISQLDFMRTARAKGLSESQIYWRHGLRNAILPNISLLIHVFPTMFSGSIIIEEIFRIPGLGTYIFESVQNNNTPAILAVFSILGLFTLIGYLLSDLLIFAADPRIRLSKETLNE